MEITHESFNKILHKDYGESFKRMFSNRNFEDLLTEIDSISNLADDYGYLNSDIEGEEKSSKYKFIGDLFEIFAEVFFLQFKSDNRVGVFDYKPVPSEDDNGVDGFGKNIEGLPCTIQIKYRGNPTYKLTERDIKQFGYQSIINYDVDWKRNDAMIVFTNCEGLHWYSESKVFDNKIRVINGKMISSIIDNNEGFWKTFEDIVDNTIKNKGIDKLYKLYKKIK